MENGKRNILFNQIKDSVSTKNNGGYKMTGVTSQAKAIWVSLRITVQNVLGVGQGAVISTVRWKNGVCVPHHAIALPRRPAKTAVGIVPVGPGSSQRRQNGLYAFGVFLRDWLQVQHLKLQAVLVALCLSFGTQLI